MAKRPEQSKSRSRTYTPIPSPLDVSVPIHMFALTWKSPYLEPIHGNGGPSCKYGSTQKRSQEEFERMTFTLYKYVIENTWGTPRFHEQFDADIMILEDILNVMRKRLHQHWKDGELSKGMGTLKRIYCDLSVPTPPDVEHTLRQELKLVAETMIRILLDLRDSSCYNYFNREYTRDYANQNKQCRIKGPPHGTYRQQEREEAQRLAIAAAPFQQGLNPNAAPFQPVQQHQQPQAATNQAQGTQPGQRGFELMSGVNVRNIPPGLQQQQPQAARNQTQGQQPGQRGLELMSGVNVRNIPPGLQQQQPQAARNQTQGQQPGQWGSN